MHWSQSKPNQMPILLTWFDGAGAGAPALGGLTLVACVEHVLDQWWLYRF
jgi:hypothetical protein